MPTELIASYGAVVDVAVVLQPDLHEVPESGLGHALLGQLRLPLRDRDADAPDPVVGGGVDQHRSPPAPDVEEPHARSEPELATDEVVLVRLGGREVLLGAAVHRARIGHRRSEDHPVELVRHVVVVRDRLGVTMLRVEATMEVRLLGGRLQRSQPSQTRGLHDVEGEVPRQVEGALEHRRHRARATGARTGRRRRRCRPTRRLEPGPAHRDGPAPGAGRRANAAGSWSTGPGDPPSNRRGPRPPREAVGPSPRTRVGRAPSGLLPMVGWTPQHLPRAIDFETASFRWPFVRYQSPFSARPTARWASRSASRLAMSWRLSTLRLPLPSPISTFALPSLK